MIILEMKNTVLLILQIGVVYSICDEGTVILLKMYKKQSVEIILK